MADKKTKGLGIFQKTEPDESRPAASEPQPLAPKKPGRKKTRDYQPQDVAPIGVGLTHAEGERLTEMAEELGVNRHTLLLWIVREFMRKYENGERPPTETRRVLKTD